MKIRSLSWGAADLSWSVVMEEILHAMEQLGHSVDFISTNGVSGMRYFDSARMMQSLANEREMQKSNTPYDIDITFTVPNNYDKRFLKTSRVKFAITDYESFPAPGNWKQWYHIPDRILPGSQWVADALMASGCPPDKITVVPHGVDLGLFNPNTKPYNLKTQKGFKFLCVAEPHFRKQLDVLLETYCRTFTMQDNVCLILKTKLFKNGETRKGFEQDLRPILARLVRQYGAQLPEIKIVTERLPNLSELYVACDAFVLMTAAEGFGVPFLEALACGLVVIAPRFGGQLDFLNDENSILCKTERRSARAVEQYWGQTIGSYVGAPDPDIFSAAMRRVYEEGTALRNRIRPCALQTANKFSWAAVAEMVIQLASSIMGETC